MRDGDEQLRREPVEEPPLELVGRRAERREPALPARREVLRAGAEEVVGLEDVEHVRSVGVVERVVAEPALRRDLGRGDAHPLRDALGGHARAHQRTRRELHAAAELGEPAAELRRSAHAPVGELQPVAERGVVAVYLRTLRVPHHQDGPRPLRHLRLQFFRRHSLLPFMSTLLSA